MAEWKDVEIRFAEDFEPMGEGLGTALQAITTIVGTGVSILELLSAFLTVSDSPVMVGIQLLLSEIQATLENLADTGVHSLSMIPTTIEEFELYRGGYGRFEQLFYQSLHDTEDPNRPQFSGSATTGGLVLMITDSNPSTFIELLFQLFSFFDKPFDLRYPAPVNVKIKPAGQLGLPEDQLLNVFTDEGRDLDRLRIEWQEPRISNDVLLDIFAENKFYIERSKTRQGDIELTERIPATRMSPQERRRENEEITHIPARDEFGDLIFHWEPLDPNDPFIEWSDTLDVQNSRINFLAGSYAHIITGMEKGSEHGYYYRVRSVPKNTGLASSTKMVRNAQGSEVEKTVYELMLGNDKIGAIARPSNPVFGFVPDIDTSFDLPSALLNTYRAAYLLRFDARYKTLFGIEATGPSLVTPAIRPSLYEQIGAQDYDYLDTTPEGETFTEVLPFFDDPLFSSEELEEDSIEKVLSYEEMRSGLRASLVIDANTFDPFGGVDEFLEPRLGLSPNVRLRLAMDKLIDTKVKALVPYLAANDGLLLSFQNLYKTHEDAIQSLLTGSGVTGGVHFLDLSESSDIRRDVFSLLQLINSGDTQGIPPNWESTQVLNDYFPFVNRLTNQLSDLIFSLSNVLQTTLDEFDATIASLQTRLEILTNLLDLITEVIAVIDEFASLAANLRLLWIPPAEGGNEYLMSELRNADNAPDRVNDELVASLVFVFGGSGPADVAAIQTAFQFLFGV